MNQSRLQPTLEDNLVKIRPLNEQDFESLYQVAKDPLIWEQHTDERYKKEVFSSFFEKSLSTGRALIIENKETKAVIGTSRYQPMDQVETAIEIGWTFIARKYWGGIYNKAIKTLLIDYAFNFYEDVIFYVDRENIRSQKAVEKIGAERQSTESPFSVIRRDDRDVVYRIHRNSWTKTTGY